MSRKRKLEPDANGEGASGGDTNEPIAESWSKTEQYKVKVSVTPFISLFLLVYILKEFLKSGCTVP